MVFPIFNTNNSGQLAQYLPIAQQTNPSAACYYIYDNFNVIISEIGNYITSLYTVHYISPVQADDPMSRIVKLTASSGPTAQRIMPSICLGYRQSSHAKRNWKPWTTLPCPLCGHWNWKW
jgi:hypothetical protein